MNKKYHPHRDYPFFLHGRRGEDTTYYRTEEDRDAAAKEAIQEYLDDGWNDEVENITIGVVTHLVVQRNRTESPPESEIDESGFDDKGNHWNNDFDYICNYEMERIGQ